MCDYVDEALYLQLLQARNLEQKRLYLARCLQQDGQSGQETAAPEPALTPSN